MPRSGRGLGTLALAAWLVAGCAPERGSTLPSPPAPSTSGSSGTTQAAVSRKQLVAEAVAAARAYYAALDVAVGTGRVEVATKLTTADCSCRRLLGNIADVWKSGSVRGDRFFVVRKVRARDVSAAVAQIDVVYDGQAYDVLRADGTVRDRVPAEVGKQQQIEMVRGSGRWLIHAVRSIN